MSRNFRPVVNDGVFETDRSPDFSALPGCGINNGVESFFGVWKSLVTTVGASCDPVAMEVVTSLDVAEVTSGGATLAKVAEEAGTGVFCIELGCAIVDAGLFDSFAATAAAPVAVAAVTAGLGDEVPDAPSRWNRGEAVVLPALLEGTVLLLCTPPAAGTGVAVTEGDVPSERLLCLLDTERLRRRLPNLRTLSAAALEFEPERLITVRDLFGVGGVLGALGLPF